MSNVEESVGDRLVIDPLPANLTSVQPGGGVCYRVELAWGCWRRWWLKHFRPAYVQRMAGLRIGDAAGAPHEIIDPRDLKYCRNVTTCGWSPDDDPFRWRDHLPVTRWGLAELQIMGWPLVAACVGLGLSPWPALAAIPAIPLVLLIYFFRDPARKVPSDSGLIVSPADGTIAEITALEHDNFIGGPATRIGIFLSIFNVHLNRAPERARVIRLHYSPGEFLNALDPQSAIRNENLWIGLEQEGGRRRKMVVRQIAGLIARRIVCQLRPGEVVERGAKFGMIKLGSRTELILPTSDDLEVLVKVGDKVCGGSTTLARYGD